MFCDGDGKPLNEKIIADHVDHAARAAKLNHRGVLRSPSPVLFAPGDAWRTGKSNSGTGWTRGSQNHAAVMHLSPAALRVRFDCWIKGIFGDMVEDENYRDH